MRAHTACCLLSLDGGALAKTAVHEGGLSQGGRSSDISVEIGILV